MDWQARYHTLHSVFEDPLRTKYYTQWIIGAFACRLAPKIMCIKIYTHTKKTPSIIIIKRVKEDNRMSTNRKDGAFLAPNNKGGVLNIMQYLFGY